MPPQHNYHGDSGHGVAPNQLVPPVSSVAMPTTFVPPLSVGSSGNRHEEAKPVTSKGHESGDSHVTDQEQEKGDGNDDGEQML